MTAMAYLVNNTWVAIVTGYKWVKVNSMENLQNLIKTVTFI